MWFGQVVVGAPGAGKSTYCNGMQQMCTALGRRHIVANLDFAADDLPFDCSIDIRELMTVERAMMEHSLGPNGALVFCAEYLLENFDWLEEQLQKYPEHYVIFDCPGQVELYTHYHAMRRVLERLQKKLDVRLTAVHLVDSTLCTDAFKYLSAVLVSLSGQLLLELPHVNVLSKIDLLKHYKKELDFRIDFYSEVQDLSQLLLHLERRWGANKKFLMYTQGLCELIEDFGLTAFRLLDIQDKESVIALLKEIDTSNGFGLISLQSELNILNLRVSPPNDVGDHFGAIHERYIDTSTSDDGEDEGDDKDEVEESG